MAWPFAVKKIRLRLRPDEAFCYFRGNINLPGTFCLQNAIPMRHVTVAWPLWTFRAFSIVHCFRETASNSGNS